MEISYLQWIGYAASGIIALSMTMNSILKFRWINLCGALTFATYGFLFGAYPVGILNTFIASVDIFYLTRIYTKKDLFDTLEIRRDNKYLLKFLDFHQKEINRFFPGFTYKPDMNTVSFFVLRDTNIAGIFLAHAEPGGVLKVGLDYVVPQYRDYRNGKFLYEGLKGKFIQAGFTSAVAEGLSQRHEKYLKKVGFVKNTDGIFELKFNA